MKKRIFLLSVVSVMFLYLLYACGGGGSTSSNTVSDKVWYVIGVSVPMSSTNARACKADVDVFANVCNDGTFLIDHTTPATFTLTRVDPATDPGSLFLESYTIQYVPMAPNAPIIPELTVHQTQELKEGDNTVTVMVMGIQQKDTFASLFSAGQQSTSILPAGYNLAYTFTGHNSYGQPWSYHAQAPIFVGQYNECVPCS